MFRLVLSLYLLFLILVSPLSLYGVGFVMGTLVKTPNGYIAIEKLKEGDEVIGFDEQGKCSPKKVNAVHSKTEYLFYVIACNNSYTLAAHDQLFKLPFDGKWLAAEDIHPGVSLLSRCTQALQVYDGYLAYLEEPISYGISLAAGDAVLISHDDIVVRTIPAKK